MSKSAVSVNPTIPHTFVLPSPAPSVSSNYITPRGSCDRITSPLLWRNPAPYERIPHNYNDAHHTPHSRQTHKNKNSQANTKSAPETRTTAVWLVTFRSARWGPPALSILVFGAGPLHHNSADTPVHDYRVSAFVHRTIM